MLLTQNLTLSQKSAKTGSALHCPNFDFFKDSQSYFVGPHKFGTSDQKR